MSVAYDSVGMVEDFGVTGKTTPAFTIGAGSNRAAAVGLGVFAATSAESCSVGGVSGTLVTGTTGTISPLKVMIFAVIAPPSGSQTCTASWTTAASVGLSVITASNVNQTTPLNNGMTAQQAFAATVGGSITSASGDLSVSLEIDDSGDGDATLAAPSTGAKRTTGSTAGNMGIGDGSGTVTHTWTLTTSNKSIMCGANFVQAGGAAVEAFRRRSRPFPWKPSGSRLRR